MNSNIGVEQLQSKSQHPHVMNRLQIFDREIISLFHESSAIFLSIDM